MLVEADVARGRTLTPFPSVRTDLRNAGANVVDQEVVTDQGLVSSRHPGFRLVPTTRAIQAPARRRVH